MLEVKLISSVRVAKAPNGSAKSPVPDVALVDAKTRSESQCEILPHQNKVDSSLKWQPSCPLALTGMHVCGCVYTHMHILACMHHKNQAARKVIHFVHLFLRQELVVWAGLKLVILLHQPSECRSYKHILSHPTKFP